MEWTEEFAQQVIDAIGEKSPNKIGLCAVCAHQQWALNPGFAVMVLNSNSSNIQLAGSSMPLAALNCTNCGNTVLLNLISLGLLAGDSERDKEIPSPAPATED